MYSDIALIKGHAGKVLHGARDAFRMGAVEAGKLADIMRQVLYDLMSSRFGVNARSRPQCR